MCLEVPMQSVRMQVHTLLTFHGYWRSVLLTRSTDADAAGLFNGTEVLCF